MTFYRNKKEQDKKNIYMKQEIIRLWSACNQKCLFCNQEEIFDAKTKKSILTELVDSKRKGVERIVISWGEPTLFRAELEFTIITSQRLGFKKIELQSNAVLLSSLAYTQKLKDMGVTDAMISLHAFDDETSDTLTQAKWTHKLTLKWIKNLIEVWVVTTLNFVTNRLNYTQLESYTRDVHKNIPGFKWISFSIVVPGTLTTEFDLLPKYSEISPYLIKAYQYCIDNNIDFQNPGCGIPLCFVKDYYKNSLEYRELYSQRLDDEFILEKNSGNKSKGSQCSTCSFNNYCLWVWNGYAQKYGYEELKPIT